MADFWLKKGDLLPVWSPTLTDDDGNPEPLGDAIKVEARIVKPDGTKLALRECTIADDASTGVVTLTWIAGDTDTPGRLKIEFVVTYAGGTKTFPSVAFARVQVAESLA
jgi:hypothetical protein